MFETIFTFLALPVKSFEHLKKKTRKISILKNIFNGIVAAKRKLIIIIYAFTSIIQGNMQSLLVSYGDNILVAFKL